MTMPKDIKKSKWYKTRPEKIKRMIDHRPIGKYVMLKTGTDYYVPYSYCENGTMSVIRYDHRTDEALFKVFGIDPDELLPIPTDNKRESV